jgi:hypothetical protein
MALTGPYETELEAATACGMLRYACVDENCNEDPDGLYLTSDCDDECAQRYDCIDGSCVLVGEGLYGSLAECEAACGGGTSCAEATELTGDGPWTIMGGPNGDILRYYYVDLPPSTTYHATLIGAAPGELVVLSDRTTEADCCSGTTPIGEGHELGVGDGREPCQSWVSSGRLCIQITGLNEVGGPQVSTLSVEAGPCP